MGFDASRMSHAMQVQALSKMQAQGKPRPKYHNTPTESNGITFDSHKEAIRYEDLMLMQGYGLISDLRLQVNFTLLEGYTTSDGKRIRPIVYKADFTYRQNGKYVVEDVKSSATKTKTYLMKKKMLRDKYDIEILEVT